MRIGIILASTRQGRRGEAFAKWILGLVAGRPGVEAELLDLREHALPPYTNEKMPSAVENDYADPVARRWSEKIRSLDGFVVVTPEYNHGYPGQLKNAIDHVNAGWAYKPVAFVGYGGTAGGARAVEQLRGVFLEVRMVLVRTDVTVRLIGLQTDEAGAPADPFYPKRAKGLVDELIWWARASANARAADPPPVP